MADPVWVLVMFDFPVLTKAQRREANAYRNMLYDSGFSQVQFSIYVKYLINATGLRALVPRLKGQVPLEGEVRVLRLTDEQWAGMFRYYGARDVAPEERPSQMLLITDAEIAARGLEIPTGRKRGKRK